jgi:hypothetical protein
MAGMTLYYLRNQTGDRSGRRLSLHYTIVMFLLTIANYYTTAKVMEAIIIEMPANTPETSDANQCGPTNVVATVVSILQVLLSDGLMVRLLSVYCCLAYEHIRFIAHMLCTVAHGSS